MSAQGNETGDDDEYEYDDLEDTEDVLEPQAIPHTCAVEEEGKGDCGEADKTTRPLARVLLVGGSEDVLAEDD